MSFSAPAQDTSLIPYSDADRRTDTTQPVFGPRDVGLRAEDEKLREA
jgi:hypothetical protein